MLHLKVLEIRNSIAHLQYSNDQLKPYAEGTASPTGSQSAATPVPDQDCIEAIAENEQVIDRMHERIALIRAEVEERGVSWTEFQSKEELESKHPDVAAEATENGDEQARHSAWSDGTFQTGTIGAGGQVMLDEVAGSRTGNITNGQTATTGGSLNDQQLREAIEARIRSLEGDAAEDEQGGMHL